MICKNCGAEIPDESAYCMKCGAGTSLTKADLKVIRRAQNRDRRRKTALWAVLIVLLIVFSALRITGYIPDITAYPSMARELLDSGAGALSSRSVPAPSPTPSPDAMNTARPSPTPFTPTPAPKYYKVEFFGQDVYRGDEFICEMAIAYADPEEVAALSDELFIHFCRYEVEPLLEDGFTYVTLDYGGGTGLVFYQSVDDPIYYGAINNAGMITETYRYYHIHDKTVTWDAPAPSRSMPEATPTPAPTQPADVRQFVLNTETNVFHVPSCRDVDKMNPENRLDYTGTRDEVIGMGYRSCGHCNP